MDSMDKWQTLIDKQIQEAAQKGQMTNLPGEGKPLILDDNPHTPPELRLAHKVLRDSNLAPEWMMEGKALDDAREKLLAHLHQSYQAYQAAQQADVLTHSRATAIWLTAKSHYEKEGTKLNRQIMGYNLKVPQGVQHKMPVNLERELKRLGG